MTSISENSQKKTYVIGITGSIGCGKSLVGRQLQEMGVAVIDADHLSHELVNKPGPAYDKILARFGADLAISPGGPIDRKKLGAIVFNDTAARADLEAILHPAIGELQKTRTIELAKTHDIVAVLVPLLFETGSQGKYSAVWAVTVHKEIQIQRLKLRDKLSDEEVVRRIKAQWPQDKKAELADKIVDNSGSPEQTLQQVKILVSEIRTKMGLPQGQTPTPDHAPAPVEPAPLPVEPAPPADGAPAPAPVEPAPLPVEPAPPADGAPAPTPVEPAPVDTTQSETTNLRNRAALKQLGEIAAEEALEKLGDIGTTSHREATASMTMAVKASTGEEPGAGANPDAGAADKAADASTSTPAPTSPAAAEVERELEVEVRMSVRNRPGTADPKPAPAPVPVPVPVPVPTPAPTPDPKADNGGKNHLPIVACLLAFLAFLAFLLVWSYSDTPVVVKNDPTAPVVVVVNPATGCCDTVKPPVVNPLPVDPIVTPPVVKPVEPGPTPVVPPVGNCKAGVETLSEPPAFILGNLHNQVRWRVVKWTVTSDGVALNGASSSCLHTTVDGRDAEGRLVVRQFYGTQLAYQGQYTINYNADCTTQVDRFNEHNVFIGRSVYLTNSDGKLVQAIQLDGNQRKLFTVTIELARDGSLYAVSYQSFAASGQTKNGYFEKVSHYRDFLTANFYLAELALK
ncbi:MAG: dephospho-CoA kinase [Candidatus Obscuribacterales bacterium]|jgi:dephospho-CoA kinase